MSVTFSNVTKMFVRRLEQYKKRMDHESARAELEWVQKLRKVNVEFQGTDSEKLDECYRKNPSRRLFTILFKFLWGGEIITKPGKNVISIVITDFNRVFKGLKRLKRKPESNKQTNNFFSGVVS